MNDTRGTGWFEENMQDPEFRRLFERESVAEDFLARIEEIMGEREVTRTRLAELMDCKPANITRIMRRTNNMTLATMVDMGLALNHRVRIFLDAAIDGAWLGMSNEGHQWAPALIQGGAAPSVGAAVSAPPILRSVEASPAESSSSATPLAA